MAIEDVGCVVGGGSACVCVCLRLPLLIIALVYLRVLALGGRKVLCRSCK